MERIRLKKSLYIGLGGTGVQAILQAKKIFKETYPNIKEGKLPMIGFLGIDTNKKALETCSTPSMYGDIMLENDERLPITVRNANTIYNKQTDFYDWINKNNLFALDTIEDGAGQFRTNGRFAFTENYNSIYNAVQDILSHITNANVRDNDQFEVISGDVDCHIVFSVCGGTGCGTFLNMAYLLRELAPGCKISGYAVLPSIFKDSLAASDVKRVDPNAYGAIQDLDYLMHLEAGSEPLLIKYHGKTFSTRDIEHPTPYDSFIFIDDKSTQNDTYSSVKDLVQMLGIFLVTTAGAIDGNDGAMDNVRHDIASKNMDIANQKAWVSGVGACEIFYKYQDLKDLNALNVVTKIINNLKNTSELNVTEKVADWANNNRINEHSEDNADQVIDDLCSAKPKIAKIEVDKNKPQTDLENYVRGNDPSAEIDKKWREKLETVSQELKALVKECINKDNGIGDTSHLLTGIINHLSLSLDEMKSEKDEHAEKKEGLERKFADEVETLKKLEKKTLPTLFHKGEIKDSLSRITDFINKIATENREVLRRDGAIKLFNGLISAANSEKENIDNIGKRFDAIYEICDRRITDCTNRLKKSTEIFRINLGADAVKYAVAEDITISEFKSSLKYENGIYDIYNAEKDPETILNVMIEYANSLPQVKKWDEDGKFGTIDKIIDGTLDDDQFENLTNRAIAKASPLLKFDDHGYEYSPIHDSFYACVPNQDNSRFKTDDYLSKHIHVEEKREKSRVEFESIGCKDRIILYRIFSVIPPFTIAPVSSFKGQYDRDKENLFFHFGTDLYNRMVEDGYELFPSSASDEALNYWVKGLVFGLISYKNKCYYYKNELDDTIAADNFLKKLSSDRVESFRLFKDDLKSLKKYFDNKFKEKINNFEYNQMIEDAKVDDNYKLKYSLIKSQLQSLDTLETKSYKETKKQLNDEINCAKALKKE